MQCPGCGFENEKDNKFCNMCGMGLPGAADSAAVEGQWLGHGDVVLDLQDGAGLDRRTWYE